MLPSYLWAFPRVSHMCSQTSLASLHLVPAGHPPFAALAPIFSVLPPGHCCVHQAPQSLLQLRKSTEGAQTVSCCSVHWQRMPLHLCVLMSGVPESHFFCPNSSYGLQGNGSFSFSAHTPCFPGTQIYKDRT